MLPSSICWHNAAVVGLLVRRGREGVAAGQLDAFATVSAASPLSTPSPAAPSLAAPLPAATVAAVRDLHRRPRHRWPRRHLAFLTFAVAWHEQRIGERGRKKKEEENDRRGPLVNREWNVKILLE
ncbi:Os01g0267000 [Oryza sativa Japonica Group]|nr:Os01g0267000 [Oryza sativa Japonica Group]